MIGQWRRWTRLKPVGIFVLIVSALAAGFFVLTVRSEDAKELTVLMYHQVVPDTLSNARYRITEENLASHIETLQARDYHVLSTNELHDFVSGDQDLPSSSVILSFDDGTANHYRHVLPLLKRLDVAGIFFVVSDWVGDSGMMTFTQLRELEEEGMVVGSHSQTHPYNPSLRELPDSAMRRELRKSKKALEDSLGVPIHAFSVPGGWYDDRTLVWGDSAGYRWMFTSDIGKNGLPVEGKTLRRLEVTGNTDGESLVENVLSPTRIVVERSVQRVKHVVYAAIGPRLYRSLGDARSAIGIIVLIVVTGTGVAVVAAVLKTRRL